MYDATGDEALKTRAAAVVAGLAECQAKLGNGYVSTFPEQGLNRVLGRGGEPVRGADVPWYNLHKILQGLLDQWQRCGNTQARDVLLRLTDWTRAITDPLSDEQMQRMLHVEHGGMNDTFAQLYAVTKDPAHLRLSLRFNHREVVQPAVEGRDTLTGLHANTQIPKFVGLATQFDLTSDDDARKGSEFFWRTVIDRYSYPNGGNSDQEHFTDPATLSRALSPNTTETCNVYNLLKLTRQLFTRDPRADYADYCERALINQIFPHQNRTNGWMLSYVPLAAGSERTLLWADPRRRSACCLGTGMENPARFGESIYFHARTNELYIALYLASQLTWKDRGVVLMLETAFPEADSARFTFRCESPTDLTLHLRRPAWVGKTFSIHVNGQPVPAAGPWVAIRRTWKTGDIVEVTFPMTLHAESFRDDPRRLAFFHGPTLLAGEVEPGNSIAYVLAANTNAALAALRPVSGQRATYLGAPDTFRTSLIAPTPGPVRFSPMYDITDKGYTCFWDLVAPAAWGDVLKSRAEEISQWKSESPRLVDEVRMNGRSERDHAYKAFKTNWRPLMRDDRVYRQSDNDGWLQWTLRALPDHPLTLRLSLWTGDDDSHAFDVLVNDRKVGEHVHRKGDGQQFISVPFPVPALTGTNAVVRLQAHPGKRAGTVYGLALLKEK
jgi:DUF1680 family protein